MKSFTFAALASAAAAINVNELEFLNYAAQYNKVYDEIEEFALRLERFLHWHRIINDHNATNGLNFNLGHNQFSDWTDAEYKAILGYNGPGSENEKRSIKVSDDNNDKAVPLSFNWVEKGFVGPVKNQGHCGSCWAFSTIGSLEGAHFAATGELLSFSEQHLIDCAKNCYKKDM